MHKACKCYNNPKPPNSFSLVKVTSRSTVQEMDTPVLKKHQNNKIVEIFSQMEKLQSFKKND